MASELMSTLVSKKVTEDLRDVVECSLEAGCLLVAVDVELHVVPLVRGLLVGQHHLLQGVRQASKSGKIPVVRLIPPH